MYVQFRHRIKKVWLVFVVFLKWLGIGSVIGLTIGSISTLFHFTLEYAVAFFTEHNWMVWLLPLAGALTVLLYHFSKMNNDSGANLILHWVRSAQKKPPIQFAPLIFIATALTQLFGGSAGREGAALQMGGCLGAWFGKWFRLDKNDMRMISMCGMSAAFSALFGTPITAVVLAMEVISIGVMYYAAIVPCTVASVVGFLIAHFFGSQSPSFPLNGVPAIGLLPCLQVIALGLLCALLSIAFCRLLRKSIQLAAMHVSNQIVRIVIGGFAIAALTFICKTNLYNCAGMSIVYEATQNTVGWQVFLLKMLFTIITISAGFKGGEIVPTFAIGASFGAVAGGLLGLAPSFGAGLGLASLFCGVLNCPLTALILSVELFGTNGFLYFVLSISVSYMLSGYSGLYSEQRILYSKLKTKFINHKIG